MTHTIDKVGACRVKFTVEATASEIAPIYKNTRSLYIAQAKVPGFRPGKAPLEQITKLYGKDMNERIQQSVFSTLLGENKTAGIKIEALVDIENVSISEENGAKATFILDTKPEFASPSIDALNVAKMNVEVTDADIESQLAEIRRMASTFREGVAGDVATEEDLIAIAFSSDLNKDELSDAAKHYASDDEYWVQIREDAFIPGLKDALTGKTLGETVQHTATYPEDFRITDLAGKTVNYSITIKTMRKLETADEEAAVKRFGMANIDELKDAITKHITATKERSEGDRVAKEICAKLDEMMTFDLPEKKLTITIFDLLNRDPAKPLETFKDDIEALRASDSYAKAKEEATKDLRRLYTLIQIAQERDIKISAEDFDAAIDNLGSQINLKRDEVIARLKANDRMDDFLNRELASKTLDILTKECAVL